MAVLDLSNNNANLNPNFRWLAGHGVTGVMLKVSEGASFADPVFANWAGRARNHGLRVGGYHFAQPDGGDPIKEADWFCQHLGPIADRDYRPALDLEQNPGHLNWTQLVAWARAFNQEVFKKSGTLPMFYASRGWIEKMQADVPIGAALWLADWGPNDGLDHGYTVPAPWKKVQMHQFTSKGYVGTWGPVDKNKVIAIAPLLAFPTRGL